MLKLVFISFLFFNITFGQTDESNIDFPKLILTEADTIAHTFSGFMHPSTATVYGIGVLDSLVLTEGTFSFDEESICTSKKEETNRLKLFVDASNPDFHSHFLSEREKLPPPPPIGLDILDSIYVDSIGRYDYVMNETGDSLVNDYTNIIEKKQKFHYKSYPFFLFNSSEEDITVSNPISGDIYVILEALDKEGMWKPVEYWEQHRFLCGTGHMDYNLSSKTFLVGAFKRFQGGFYTKLRMKLNTSGAVLYSNVFEDSIDYRQFDNTEIVEKVRLMFSGRDEEYIQRKIHASFLE